MAVSVIIRTFNEERHLAELLQAVYEQEYPDPVEVIVVDSGSTDRTLEIAGRHHTRIVRLAPEDFTFGHSLNLGCAAATGDLLVFVSGHCVPASRRWLSELLRALSDARIAMTYGRQIGAESTRFSEHQIFAKYFPDQDSIPQHGFFANNANSAIRKSDWESCRFDEELTGLEDMAWAKTMTNLGRSIGYVAGAPVRHIHHETWRKVRLRYEREAIALQKIMPEVHLHLADVLRYFFSAVLTDWSKAIGQRCLRRCWAEIVMFRFCQYYGSYRGNHEHRVLSSRAKERYFYPT